MPVLLEGVSGKRRITVQDCAWRVVILRLVWITLGGSKISKQAINEMVTLRF